MTSLKELMEAKDLELNSNQKRSLMMVQGVLISILENLDRDVIQYKYIERMKLPPIFSYEIPLDFKPVFNLITQYKDDIKKYLDADTIMEILRTERPDLSRILDTENGFKWLKAFLKVIIFLIDHLHLGSMYKIERAWERKREQKRKEREQMEREKVKEKDNLKERVPKENVLIHSADMDLSKYSSDLPNNDDDFFGF